MKSLLPLAVVLGRIKRRNWRQSEFFLLLPLQQKLNTLRSWTERVRSMDAYHVTESGLVFVNCKSLQEQLIQRLSLSYKQLISFVIKEAMTIGKEFVREMKEILKVREIMIGLFKSSKDQLIAGDVSCERNHNWFV